MRGGGARRRTLDVTGHIAETSAALIGCTGAARLRKRRQGAARDEEQQVLPDLARVAAFSAEAGDDLADAHRAAAHQRAQIGDEVGLKTDRAARNRHARVDPFDIGRAADRDLVEMADRLGGRHALARAAQEHVAAKAAIDGEVLRETPQPRVRQRRDRVGCLTVDQQHRMIVGERRAAHVSEARFGHFVADVHRIMDLPRRVHELVRDVVERRVGERRQRAGGGRIVPEVAQARGAELPHGGDRAARAGLGAALRGLRELDHQLAQRRLGRPARLAVVAQIDEPAVGEPAREQLPDRVPNVRADPAVDAVHHDEVERRQIPVEQRVEARFVEHDVAGAEPRRASLGGFDVGRIEVARVEFGVRERRGVDHGRMREAAAEIEVAERPVKRLRAGAAEHAHIIEP